MAEIDEYLSQVREALADAKNDEQLFDAIVNAAFINKRLTTVFGLGFITFLLYNKKTGDIDRIKKSNNELAILGGQISVKPFEVIKVPLSYQKNIIASAIKSGSYKQTSDWANILSPDLTDEESRLNQAKSGIACSFVFPFNGRDGGALIFHFYVAVHVITTEHRNFMHRYTKLVGLALDKKL